MRENLKIAQEAAKEGIHVFPCNSYNKTPYIRAWQHNATTDSEQIRRWWMEFPDAMIGAQTGHKSGFFALDIDIKDGIGAYQKFDALQDVHGRLNYTHQVQTPSGGMHFYFKMPELDIRSTISKLGSGIDIKANGGYVIYYGSVNFENKKYLLLQKRGGHAN